MLEHRARRDRQTRPPRPAHQLDRHDAVAAKLEEVVLDADPRKPQHLGKQPAQHRLLRVARRTLHSAPTTAPAQAAHGGRACRSASAADDPAPRSQTAPCAPAARRDSAARSRRASSSTAAPRRRHHIANQPRLAAPAHPSRATTTACDTPPAAAAQPRSRQARSGTRAASPARPHGPKTPAPRPNATAPGPRSGTSASQPRHRAMRVRHKPLRRQTRTPQITPRKTQHPRCKARQQHPKEQAQDNRPEHKHDNSADGRPIGTCSAADHRSQQRWPWTKRCIPLGHIH